MDSETRKELEKGMMPFINAMIENEDMIRNDINKISFLESNLPFEVIKKEFEHEFNVIPCTVSVFGKDSGIASSSVSLASVLPKKYCSTA